MRGPLSHRRLVPEVTLGDAPGETTHSGSAVSSTSEECTDLHNRPRVISRSPSGEGSCLVSSASAQPEWDPQLRDRVKRLMRVLRAIAAAKTRPTRHTASCHGVQWLGEAAEHLVVHQ